MTGRPKRRALVHELTKRAADECEDGTAHLDYVLRWIEGGRTMSELSREISYDAKEDIHGSYITRYLTDTYPEYTARVAAARRLGAHAMVDEARDIIDEAPTYDKIVLAKAKERAAVRQWTAERYNRAELGVAKDVQVSVSINSLHIDALRARRATATLAGGETGTEGASVARAFLTGGVEESAYEILESDDSAIESAIPIEHTQLNLL